MKSLEESWGYGIKASMNKESTINLNWLARLQPLNPLKKPDLPPKTAKLQRSRCKAGAKKYVFVDLGDGKTLEIRHLMSSLQEVDFAWYHRWFGILGIPNKNRPVPEEVLNELILKTSKYFLLDTVLLGSSRC